LKAKNIYECYFNISKIIDEQLIPILE